MFRNKQLDRIEKKLDSVMSILGFDDNVTIVFKADGAGAGVTWGTEVHLNPTVNVRTEQESVSPAKNRLQKEAIKLLAEEPKKRKYVKSGKYSKKVTTKKK